MQTDQYLFQVSPGKVVGRQVARKQARNGSVSRLPVYRRSLMEAKVLYAVLSTLASIRRKPKASENGYVNADLEPPVMHYNDHLNNSSLATDDHSFLSNGVSSERDGSIHQSTLQQSPSDGMPSSAPTSPASLNSPSLRKAPSISESLSGSVQQAVS